MEVKAQGQDYALAAWGVQSAVADLLTPKGKAMKAYLKAIGADGSSGSGANTHSRQGGELAKRIRGLLNRGELD